MADPVRAIVKKLLPGVRRKKIGGSAYWEKRMVVDCSVFSKAHPEFIEIQALWKLLCAALTEALGKPTVKKSMSRSWQGARCWYYVASNGIKHEYTVGVERTPS